MNTNIGFRCCKQSSPDDGCVTGVIPDLSHGTSGRCRLSVWRMIYRAGEGLH